MEREELLAKLRALSDRGHGAAGYVPAFLYEQEILAELDRLTAENERLKVSHRELEDCLGDSGRRVKSLQSHLDRISEPMKGWNKEGRDYVIALLEQGGWYPQIKIAKAIADYLDPQKPSETDSHIPIKQEPNKWQYAHVGRLEDCPICNPECEHKNFGKRIYCVGEYRPYCFDCHTWIPAKPLTQCPECIWGQKIVYVNSYIVPVFVEGRWDKQDWVYGRCPRCKGEGRIPC